MAKVRAVTLKDVATAANVDVSTVSRAISGNTTHRIPEATRDRIVSLAETLGYRPNQVARELKSGKSRTIAVMTPDLSNLSSLEILRGIQDVAGAERYLVCLINPQDVMNDQRLYKERLEGRVDGLLVAFARSDDELVLDWAHRQLPLVLVMRAARGVSGSVVLDDQKVARTMVQHLISLGHHSIGHIAGDLRIETALRRREGFLSTLADNHLDRGVVAIEEGFYTRDGGYAAAHKMLSGAYRPTALAVANLMSAFGVMAAIHDLGLCIPSDISVIAADDHIVADNVSPRLTTVRLPQYEMGVQATQMLLRTIDGEPASQIVVDAPHELIIRESTAPPRATSTHPTLGRYPNDPKTYRYRSSPRHPDSGQIQPGLRAKDGNNG